MGITNKFYSKVSLYADRRSRITLDSHPRRYSRWNYDYIPGLEIISGVSAVQNGNDVDISWTPRSGDFANYFVYRSDDGGANYSLIATITDETVGTYTDTDPGEGQYSYYVTGDSTAGAVSPQSAVASLYLNLAPSDPANLAVTAENESAVLTWDASTDQNLDEYIVYLDAVEVDRVPAGTLTYTFTGLTNGNSYTFGVQAVDALGATSATVTIVDTVLDTIAPAVPTGLSATAQPEAADATWDANGESDLAGYNIYVDSVKDNGSLIVGESYSITSLTGGVPVDVQVSAVDTSGNESALSAAFEVTPIEILGPDAPENFAVTLNQTLIFDGVDDEVNIGNPTILYNTDFTIKFKAKVNDLSGDSAFISKGIASTNEPIFIWYDSFVGTIADLNPSVAQTISVLVYDGTTQHWVSAPANSINDTDFHEYEIRISPSINTIEILIDDILVASNVKSFNAIEQTASEIRFGSVDPASPAFNPLDGEMDYVEILNGATVVGRWDFDEGSGTTATDSVGSNNGTISGATYVEGEIIKASWDAVPSVSGYNIYIDSGSGYTKLNTSLITDLSYIISLGAGSYNAYVTAFDGTDESDPSNVVIFEGLAGALEFSGGATSYVDTGVNCMFGESIISLFFYLKKEGDIPAVEYVLGGFTDVGSDQRFSVVLIPDTGARIRWFTGVGANSVSEGSGAGTAHNDILPGNIIFGCLRVDDVAKDFSLIINGEVKLTGTISGSIFTSDFLIGAFNNRGSPFQGVIGTIDEVFVLNRYVTLKEYNDLRYDIDEARNDPDLLHRWSFDNASVVDEVTGTVATTVTGETEVAELFESPFPDYIAVDIERFAVDFGDWANDAGNSQDWSRDASGTPSSSTGPSAGFDGRFYVYVETSGQPSDIVTRLEHTLEYSGAGAISFAYHMYGSQIGILSFQVFDGSEWTTLWSRDGNQSEQWFEKDFVVWGADITKIRFDYTDISGFRADAALDFIQVYTDSANVTRTKGALFFDGVDDYVSVPHSTDLQITNGMTLEAWIRFPDETTTAKHILSKRSADNADGWRFSVNANRTVRFTYFGVADYTWSTSYRIPFEEWTHIAMVIDSNFDMNLHINGDFKQKITGGTPVVTTEPMTIGVIEEFGEPAVFGRQELSDIRIWREERSEAEILANMNTELAGTETNLVAYWKCNDEDTPDTLTDSTSNGNDGTITEARYHADIDDYV